MSPTLLLPLGGYLVGSIPFSVVIVWWLRSVDVRTIGSGNAGATNVLRAAGLPAALLVLAFDVGKGALPVFLASRWQASPAILAALSVATVLGHMFPVYIGFRGGKGVATAVGVFAALALGPTLAAVGIILLLIAWKRFVSLGSIVGLALLPLLMLWWRSALWQVAVGAAIAGLVVSRHVGNIRRLRAGTERRLGEQVEVTR